MKVFLLKQERYDKSKNSIYYSNVKDDDFIISRTIKVFDDVKQKYYFCFLYEESPKLKYLPKKEGKELFSEQNMKDYCEVSYYQINKFLNQYNDKYAHILKKINKIYFQ